MIYTRTLPAISARNTTFKRLSFLTLRVLAVTTLCFTGHVLASEDGQQTALIVPHTHWEGAVFKTREEYLEEGLPHILKALNLLKKYPNYLFTLDQLCYVRPFLERYPTEVTAFRKFIAEGRLQIVGGTTLCTTATFHLASQLCGSSYAESHIFETLSDTT
jgi:hypothetical protein